MSDRTVWMADGAVLIQRVEFAGEGREFGAGMMAGPQVARRDGDVMSDPFLAVLAVAQTFRGVRLGGGKLHG